MSETSLSLERIETPIGPFAFLVDSAGRLRAAGFTESRERLPALLRARLGFAQADRRGRSPRAVRVALQRYFAGDGTAIDALAVVLDGTEFQRRVWAALREIPCGETCTYGEIARHVGKPAAVRAVGHASGANPVWVVVPCHRVIGRDGSLTGYAGGLQRKNWLLSHERQCSEKGEGDE